ncbi:CHASE3 domain-containing protein [Acaryochloris sp. CCMEE 5410]|uniref:sensor histidine kinase n=1 Tax=Acaryochloris sp. CCMEE 5410 TaxID=310037 RepID=UPI0002484AFC|nr:sensor histidine kinase [Acaryochloris sp. CCMEE 5410]KAI9132778.1 CHASE3 domain-containing protein [Acaryochloris sp. CCMEE 5410]
MGQAEQTSKAKNPAKGKSILHFWTNLSLTRQGTVILAIPLTCLLITMSAWVGTRKNENFTHRQIVHTQKVLRTSDQLLNALINAETGIRGYGLTEDPKFLAPYREALPEIEPTLRALSQQVQENPEQSQQITELKLLIQQELDILTKTLKQIENDFRFAPQAPRLGALVEQGKARMDAVRQSLQDFKDTEQEILVKRRTRLSQARFVNDALLGVSGVISLLGFAAALSLYRQTEKQMLRRGDELAATNRILATANLTLADRNKELDQFTYVVSHDLKAPLRAIANLSEWIEEDLDEKLDEENRYQMNLLRKRVHRMEALINGLLQFSRVGRRQSTIETVRVGDLLADIIDSLAPPAEFKVEIVGPMPTLQTDTLQLQQVFSNLLSNAIKHHHQSEGHIRVSGNTQLDFYEFVVSDDGPGIAADYYDKIFQIFQVLDSRDATENTGIGLSIVKKIIESKGGSIQVESEINHGTTFRFTWPQEE